MAVVTPVRIRDWTSFFLVQQVRRDRPDLCAHRELEARLAQSVERQPFKLVVVGSSPTVGV